MNKVKGKCVKAYQACKPSIKITVSADIPDNYLNTSPVKTPSPQTIVKRIVNFDGDGHVDMDSSSKETVTRITVDDSVMDFPNCIDFGIKDFLCCKDEIDLEISSDTDTSFLDATPPHRFSDSELEGQIEIMSITLDNVLNLGPKRASLNSTFSKDDLFTFDVRVTKEEASNLRLHQNTSDNEKLRETGNNLNNTTRRLPPPRPFRRHISLPASIFMTYLMAEQNIIANKTKQQEDIEVDEDNVEPLQRNNSEQLKRNTGRFSSRKLTKIDGSCSSSMESTDETSPNNDPGDNLSESSRDTPVYFNSNSSDTQSIGELDGEDLTQQAFTSEIERKSLVLRYMRKLIRQDTSVGNFAPPDYCI